MSLVGCISSVKMISLPKFLYLFQALLLFIPGSFFQSLDSVISSYLWWGKPPWLNKNHLQKTKVAGGLPNFLFYFWAANLLTALHSGPSAAAKLAVPTGWSAVRR